MARLVTYNVCAFEASDANFVTAVGINRGIKPVISREQLGSPACSVYGREINNQFLPAYGFGSAIQAGFAQKVLIVPFEIPAGHDKWAARIRHQPGAIISNMRVILSFVGGPDQPLLDLYNDLATYTLGFPLSGDPPPTSQAREIGADLFNEVITGDIDTVQLAPAGQIEIRQLEISLPVAGLRPTQTETTRNERGVHFLEFWTYRDCP